MTEIKRLASDHADYQAWMEDSDSWDGNALYVDEELAKAHAAYDYEGDEYGHPDVEDDSEAGSRPDFTWTFDHGRWYLSDHGQDTRIRVAAVKVYRHATADEIVQQVADDAAARARYLGMPMAEALEAAASDAGVTP